ncbi:MAG: hypothetical protein NC433_08415 [Clostridiales bacterium]|nr:hypothetical protein [Clostridiales bacterium]
MKRNIKQIATVLCLTMFAAMALGSGQSDSDKTKQVVSNKESETADTNESVPDTSKDLPDRTVTIDEHVLIEQDGIVIAATEYVTDSIWGDGIKLLLENNSDKDVGIGCKALIVNDYMITDLFSSTVAAGKKANETMYLSSTQLNAAGIENVGKIEIYFHVYDSSTYDTVFDTECVTIQTSEYANMDTAPNDEGTELYNQNGVRIVGKTVNENSFWGTAILLYCENTSGKNIGISVDDMSINGFMISPFFSTTVYNEKKSIDDITVFSSDLEENGIETIKEVELKFHIYDADSYSTIADTAPITFTAQ